MICHILYYRLEYKIYLKKKDNTILPRKNGEKKIINAYDKIYALFNNNTTEELKKTRDKIQSNYCYLLLTTDLKHHEMLGISSIYSYINPRSLSY